jgi:hypothetical protein
MNIKWGVDKVRIDDVGHHCRCSRYYVIGCCNGSLLLRSRCDFLTLVTKNGNDMAVRCH